jgi:hypothetical protein
VMTVATLGCHSEIPEAPSEWIGHVVTPIFELKSLWIADTGDACGLTLDVIEMQCTGEC